MEKLKLNYSHDKSVAGIIMDDGKGNVLDAVMMNELQHLLDSFRDKNNIKLITIEGAGKHFSFGASVEEHTKEKAPNMLESFHKLFYTILDIGIPTAAKVSGQCLGGGMEIALICNFIFADQSAVFGQPEIVLGVFPPPASLLLPLKIGNSRAEELLITGKSIKAERANTIGLLNALFDDRSQMEAGVEEWIVKSILPKSASSLRYATKASRSFMSHIIMKFLPELQKIYVDGLMQTHDANEGINAFLEKRKAEWNNC